MTTPCMISPKNSSMLIQVRDDVGRGLIWTGEGGPVSATSSLRPISLARRPRPTRPIWQKILTSESTLEGERKPVTVLFADLKGSTELIRDLDPEQAKPFWTRPCTP